MIILIGGGTAYASEASLPGDFLYPVKVDVAEPVVGALTFGASAQANWHEQLVERRLQESETLAEDNQLSTSSTDLINTNIQTSIQSFDNSIVDLQKTDPVQAEEVRINFLTKADVYSKILQKSNSGQVQNSNVQSIRNNLNQTIQNTFSVSLEGDASSTATGNSNVSKTNFGGQASGRFYQNTNPVNPLQIINQNPVVQQVVQIMQTQTSTSSATSTNNSIASSTSNMQTSSTSTINTSSSLQVTTEASSPPQSSVGVVTAPVTSVIKSILGK